MGEVFVFVLLSLCIYRAQRLVTTDEWPPSQALRRYVERRFGPHSSWAELVHCPWCVSVWLGAPVAFAFDYFVGLALPVAQFAAAVAVAGLIAERGEAPE